MLEDFFRKPLQYTLFEIIRLVIMGWDHIILLKTEYMSEFKERAGNDQNGVFNTKMNLSLNRIWTYDKAVMGD